MYTSAKTLLSFFNLITPVSCAEAGEDVACNCSPFTKSKPPLPTKCNCVDCESKNSDCQTIKDQQAKVGPAPAAAASPLVGKSRPGSCSGAGPCGNRKHCNEPAELDMSALSARIGALKQVLKAVMVLFENYPDLSLGLIEIGIKANDTNLFFAFFFFPIVHRLIGLKNQICHIAGL